jgi:hypothetical protein
VPLAALPANVLAAPLMGPITIGGLVVGTVGGASRTYAPVASALLLAPVVALVRALEGIASAAARVPIGIDGRSAFAILAVGCTIAAAGRLARVHSRRARSPHA